MDVRVGLSWVPKNWCFWPVVLEKTLESLLGCKEIQPVHPKGNHSWIFTGRTDAEAPVPWPPDAKELTNLKRPWCWERSKVGGEGTYRGWDDWMASLTWCTWVWASSGSWWWTGSLVCCSPWGCKESDTTKQLNWTDVGDAWNSARVQSVREWGQWPLGPVDVKCMMTVMPFRDSLFPLSSSSLKLFFVRSMSEAHTWGCWLTSSKGEALTPWLCHVEGCGPSSYLPIPSTRFS